MIPFTIQSLADAFTTAVSPFLTLVFLLVVWQASAAFSDAWHHRSEVKELEIRANSRKKLP